PFFSGNEKVLDTAGRVDRFKKRAAAGAATKATKATKAKK
nr:50S ribosomal protein L31 [Candidatus Paceibacterota bacterium]